MPPILPSMPQNPGVVAGGVLNHFDRIEARLFVQFKLAQQAEAIDLVNEAGVTARSNQAPMRSKARRDAIQMR
jgi:hypothetical protein